MRIRNMSIEFDVKRFIMPILKRGIRIFSDEKISDESMISPYVIKPFLYVTFASELQWTKNSQGTTSVPIFGRKPLSEYLPDLSQYGIF